MPRLLNMLDNKSPSAGELNEMFVVVSKARPLFLLGGMLACLALYAVQAHAVEGQCGPQYRKLYLPDKLHKAFASTGSVAQFTNQGGFACGGVGKAPTKAAAIKAALKRCERVRAKNRLKGRCKIVDAK